VAGDSNQNDQQETIKTGHPVRTRKAAKRLQIIARRNRVAEFYIRGTISLVALAKQLGVSERLVKLDLQHIRQQWRESAVRNFDEHIEIERLRLEKISQEALDAWDRSQEPGETVTVTKDASGKVTSTTIKEEERVGDGRFLEIAAKASEGRRKLLGLDTPIQKQHQHAHAHAHVHIGIDEQRSTVLALAAKLGIGDVFEQRPEQGSAAGDSQAVGGGDGLPAPPGIQQDSDHADAAAG
jgi:hypothetical protein